MGDKYEKLHEGILCLLHDLAFGQLGLKGDVNENLLRAWYGQRKEFMQQVFEQERGSVT